MDSERAIRAVVDEAGLEAWGRALGRCIARHPVFVALTGPLGAGKSTLVRAACRGAGVSGFVPSPTYTLVNILEGSRRILHADLYRLEDEADLRELGWEDLVAPGVAAFVEWAERAGADIPPDRWEIRLGITSDGTGRTVDARPFGTAPPLPEVPDPAHREP